MTLIINTNQMIQRQTQQSCHQSTFITKYPTTNNYKSKISYDETDQQYIKICSQQQILNILEHKLMTLKFIFQLHQSITIKQRYRSVRVGIILNHSNKSTLCQQNTLNIQRLKNLVMDDLFYQNITKLIIIKTQLQTNIKNILTQLYQKKQNHIWIKEQMSIIQLKIQRNYQMSNKPQLQLKQTQNLPQQQTKTVNQTLVNKNNFQNYLSSLYQYLVIQYGDIDLYEYLKQVGLRWICDHYKPQEQRYFNLLNQSQQYTQQNNKKDQTMNNNNVNTQKQQKQKPVNKIVICQSQSGEQQQNKPITTTNQTNDQPLMKMLHQSRNNISSNILYSTATKPIDNFNKPCCTTFFYNFSQIPTNKLSPNPRNTHIIFITKQSLPLNDPSQPVSFTDYQQPIKQATVALLNNQGGFIFVGFKKQNLIYQPQSPFLLSQNSTQNIRKKLQQSISKQLTLLTAKSDKQQVPYKKIKTDFIPIFTRMNTSHNDNGNQFKGQGNKGEYIWRITVQPDNENKLKIHSVLDKYYDFDQQNQTFTQIVDNPEQKDKIYTKLKQMLNCYDRFKTQKYFVLQKNSYRNVTHNQSCSEPLISQFIDKDKSLDSLNINNTSLSKQTKKKSEKLSTKQLDSKNQEQKKQFEPTQEQKIDFKQINLIVLQNKSIKQSCQAFFQDKKIQFKIQKLQSDYLKKLIKQTYVIYHHKKFDEINNYLNQFKAQFNSKKNISLISAQKSAYIDGVLDYRKLVEIKKIAMTEIPNYEAEGISYVQQIKDKQQKSFLKAGTKMGGIYLYFILSELNMKPKMKNVPTNLQSLLVTIDRAIQDKQGKQQKRTTATKQQKSGNYQQQNNNKAQRNNYKNIKNYQNSNTKNNTNTNNNTYNHVNNNNNNQSNNNNNQYYGQQRNYQPVHMIPNTRTMQNNNNYISPQYSNYVQQYTEYANNFIIWYKHYQQLYSDSQQNAMKSFVNFLRQNPYNQDIFWRYGVNNQLVFKQFNNKYQPVVNNQYMTYYTQEKQIYHQIYNN